MTPESLYESSPTTSTSSRRCSCTPCRGSSMRAAHAAGRRPPARGAREPHGGDLRHRRALRLPGPSSSAGVRHRPLRVHRLPRARCSPRCATPAARGSWCCTAPSPTSPGARSTPRWCSSSSGSAYAAPSASPRSRGRRRTPAPSGLRPTRTTASLVAGRPTFVGAIEVPGHLAGGLEIAVGEAGHEAMGFAAHIPHYLTQVEFPRAAVALLEEVAVAGDLAPRPRRPRGRGARQRPRDRRAGGAERRERRGGPGARGAVRRGGARSGLGAAARRRRSAAQRRRDRRAARGLPAHDGRGQGPRSSSVRGAAMPLAVPAAPAGRAWSSRPSLLSRPSGRRPLPSLLSLLPPPSRAVTPPAGCPACAPRARRLGRDRYAEGPVAATPYDARRSGAS